VSVAVKQRRQSPTLTLIALVAASMSYTLSQTLVSPALPLIQHDLHTSTSTVTFILTAYLLVASVATPIVGRLGDMFGKERMMMLTLVCFGAGALISAVSTSIWPMIAGRAVQGVGGAIFPLAFGIVRDEFPREKVASAIGLISATFGIGGGVGLVASGVIVDHMSYHWVYWFGLVTVLLAALMTWWWVPESPVKTPAKVDWGGALLLSGGLVAILVAVSEGNDWGWLSLRIVWLVALGLALLVLLGTYELTQRDPLVDMRMCAQRAVLTPNLAGFLVGFGMFGSFIIIPQFVQISPEAGYGFGASVTKAGVFMLPSTVGMMVSGPLAGWVGNRFGSKLSLTFGGIAMTLAFLSLAVEHSHQWAIYAGSGWMGIGVGFAYAGMANLIIEAVPQTATGAASGINTIMRTIGGTLGGQIAASLIAARIQPNGFPAEAGFTATFAMFTVAGVLAILATAAIPARAALATLIDVEAPAQPSGEPGHLAITGVVRSAHGPLYRAVVVLLDAEGHVVQTTGTDLDGSYCFPDPPLGGESVVAMADGFDPEIRELTHHAWADIVLVPARCVAPERRRGTALLESAG
jgi:EmrB/QacA subfamily drug resistance transporter